MYGSPAITFIEKACIQISCIFVIFTATLPTSTTSIRKTGTSTVSSMSPSVDGFDVNFNVSLERLIKYTVAIPYSAKISRV